MPPGKFTPYLICTGLYLFAAPTVFSQKNTPSPDLSIPLAFREAPAAPVLVADPGSDRTIAFFYPANTPYDDTYPCQAVELDTSSAGLRRVGRAGKIRFEWGWKSAAQLLASYQDNRAVYLWLLDYQTLMAVRIDKVDLSVTSATRVKLKRREDILGAVGGNDHGFLLVKEKRSRDQRVVRVMLLQADSVSTVREIPAGHLPELFYKDFKPANTASALPADPARAANPFRLFHSGDTIWITHDNISGFPGIKTASLFLYTFDLAMGVAQKKELPYLPSGLQTGIQAQGASYIVDGKLFQLYVTHGQWNLLVRDLATGILLHHEHAGLNDTVPAFNTPVRIHTSFLQTKKNNAMEALLDAHMKTLPYLIVEPAQEGYRLHLGGSRIATGNLWAVPLVLPGATPGVVLAYSSAQTSFSLFKTLEARSLQIQPTPLRKSTFFQACNELLDGLSQRGNRSAVSLYRIGNQTYLGAYLPKNEGYGFYRLTGW